ncbi:MAG: hypothetical protein IKA02_03080, partial [Clostridia bacterium]|nr:hypothetical protein [Clostridia bacterium]
MAKIKDFAKDLGMDLKSTMELIERSGVKIKSNATNIENNDISTVLHVLTTEKSVKDINKYLDGERVIPSSKSKKTTPKAETKAEPKVETKVEPKVEKTEVKVEVKPEVKVEVKP